jgi:primosomal protein N''
MADTSSYSIAERLVASVWVHERQHTGQTMSQVMAAFRERFNKAPPRRATLLDWEKTSRCTVTSRPSCIMRAFSVAGRAPNVIKISPLAGEAVVEMSFSETS